MSYSINWPERFGLKAEDGELVYRILLDAFYKKRELERQFGILNDAEHIHHSSNTAAQRDEMFAEFDRVEDDVAETLRYRLDKESYLKFNTNLGLTANDVK